MVRFPLVAGMTLCIFWVPDTVTAFENLDAKNFPFFQISSREIKKCYFIRHCILTVLKHLFSCKDLILI